MTYKTLLGVSLALLVSPLLAVEVNNAESTATTIEQETAAPETVAPETAAPETTATVAAEQSGFSRGSVVRSAFTTAIEEREPANDLKTISNNEEKIFYYTELRDMSGQTAIHRWEYNGEVKAEVKFNVRGPRWRVWSSKSFVPGWTGDWKVSVVNGANEIISEDMFSYAAAEMKEMPAPEETAPATMEPATPSAQ